MSNKLRQAPKNGYLLPKWRQIFAYRATALAYMKQEGETQVEHMAEGWFTLEEIENSIINAKP